MALDAGVGVVKLDVPEGTPLAGYVERLGRGTTGTHDPIHARCLHLDDGESQLYLISVDLCFISPELRKRVVLDTADIARPEEIVLTATHTHNGPGGTSRALAFRTLAGRYVPEFLDYAAQQIVASMRAARAARQRATVGHGEGAYPELLQPREGSNGEVDSQVGVLRVDNADGVPIAIAAVVGAHPTLAPKSGRQQISADYPGVFCRELEEQFDGCTALFLNGAGGDVICKAQVSDSDEDVGGEADDWAPMEAFGSALAERVGIVAEGIQCSDPQIRVAQSRPRLPLSMAQAFLPSHVLLQTVEIDDLSISFFPGEPTAEVGMELRRQALERGYAAHYSVGLANDYLLYFVSRDAYGRFDHTSSLALFGPRMDGWLYREFGGLMSKGTAEDGRQVVATPEPVPLPGGRLLVLSGSSEHMAHARGMALKDSIQRAYEINVVDPVASRRWYPREGAMPYIPPFMDHTRLALPLLALGARPLLTALDSEAFEAVEGLADGSGLPFDAIWLLQCASIYGEASHGDLLYRTPFCTMFAAVGDRAGADEILVGRNFDWGEEEPAIVLDTAPDGGRRYVSVGFPWNIGVFTGMNDAGLVVSVERVPTRGEPSLFGPPISLILRSILATHDTVDGAVADLFAQSHLRGYHVLLADAAGPDALVVELGTTQSVRSPEDGILLGVVPSAAVGEAEARYARVQELVAEERIVDVAEFQNVLADGDITAAGQSTVLNNSTHHSVIFEPIARRVHIAFPRAGQSGAYHTISLAEDAS
jgi:hypothetical protein